jgi:hypothetical protein
LSASNGLLYKLSVSTPSSWNQTAKLINPDFRRSVRKNSF